MISKKIQKFLNHKDVIVDMEFRKANENRYWRNYELAILNLEVQVIKKMKKNCNVLLSGFHAIGLSTRKDNIQLQVDIGNNYYNKADFERDFGQMQFLMHILQNSGEWIVHKIFNGSPSIKCTYRQTNQLFIITVGNGYKVQLNKILRHLFKIQREAQRLYHFMRLYLCENGCSLKFYQIMIFVIFYLQQRRLLPKIDEVQSHLDRVLIDGKQVQYNKRRRLEFYEIKKMVDYRDHILPFFRFYKDFNFDTSILNLNQGKDVPLDEYHLIMKDRRYVNSILLDAEVNSSASITKTDLDDFIDVCEESCEIFRKS